MSNSINPYSRASRYTRRTPAVPDAARPQPAQQTEAQPAANEASKPDAVAEAAPGDLTAQEQQVIEETFPEKPELSMRLYGRGRGAQTVNPGAVGSRLDVSG